MSNLIQRAVAVMEALRVADRPQSIRQVAEAAELSKSTVQRLLRELLDTDLVALDRVTGRYVLGPRTLAFGAAYGERLDVSRIAASHLRRLNEHTRETVGLSVEYADKLMHITQVASPLVLRAMFDVGHPLPLWSGAPSRVILAERTDEEVTAILLERSAGDVLPANPPPTANLMADIAETRRRGYATAHGETLEGVSTISAPVRDAAGRLAAIVSITVPTTRMTPARTTELIPQLLATATAIGAELGWLESR